MCRSDDFPPYDEPEPAPPGFLGPVDADWIEEHRVDRLAARLVNRELRTAYIRACKCEGLAELIELQLDHLTADVPFGKAPPEPRMVRHG